jgi:large subunit ribosomal protein L11
MTEKIQLMVEGGKATASPQMAQSLGPKGINIKEVLAKINEKTKEFSGMKIPVNIEVNKDKSYDIVVGTPPASELIKKEIGLEKGSGKAHVEKVGNLAIEQIIKIAKMKQEGMLVNSLKSAVKSVIGSCGSLGILVEGKEPIEINKEIDDGKYDEFIKTGKTEVSEEKKKRLKAQLEGVKEELEKEMEAEKAEEEKKEEKKEGKKEEEAPAEGEEKKEESKEGEEKKEEKKK